MLMHLTLHACLPLLQACQQTDAHVRRVCAC